MIGKIYYEKEWHLVKFENNVLEILNCSCEKYKRIASDEVLIDDRFLFTIFEGCNIYYFDIKSGEELEFDKEYYMLRRHKMNYFIYDNFITSKIDFHFNKITFVDGILKGMLGTNAKKKLDVRINDLNLKINFDIKETKDNKLFDISKYGRMLTNNINLINRYIMDVEFDKEIEIDELNNIIDILYKFLQFFNCDYNPKIAKIIIETKKHKLFYFKNNINYNGEYIKKWNYINNCDNLESIIQNIDKFDIEFLKLINSKQIGLNEFWILAKSIDNNCNEASLNLTDETINENLKLEKLKKIIKKDINEFENSNDYHIDEQKKNFILSSISINNFRKKVEILLRQYNLFAKVYNLKILTNDEIKTYCKEIQKIRNTIHGLDYDYNQETNDAIVYVILALYLHLLECFKCEKKFNLIKKLFE